MRDTYTVESADYSIYSRHYTLSCAVTAARRAQRKRSDTTVTIRSLEDIAGRLLIVRVFDVDGREISYRFAN